MAIYIIAAYCTECDEYFRHVGRGQPESCDICGTQKILKSVEKYSANDPYCREEVVNIAYADNHRYSVSLGVSETQIDEARKLHPQAEWKKFGHSYRPLIRNRAEKLRMMKQAGFVEFGPEQFKGR